MSQVVPSPLDKDRRRIGDYQALLEKKPAS